MTAQPSAAPRPSSVTNSGASERPRNSSALRVRTTITLRRSNTLQTQSAGMRCRASTLPSAAGFSTPVRTYATCSFRITGTRTGTAYSPLSRPRAMSPTTGRRVSTTASRLAGSDALGSGAPQGRAVLTS